MKFKFLKRAAAVVTAAIMAVSTLAVLPDEYLPKFGIVASAEETATSGQCGDNVYWEFYTNGLLRNR